MSGSIAKCRRRRWCVSVLGVVAAAAAVTAQAQVQRTFVNLGFEQPDLGSGACVGFFVGPQQVTGWNTTHPTQIAGGCGVTPNPLTGPILELWANSFNGTPARAGKQHAELNAFQASRIYQNICLTNGEVINWRLSHRGRNSATEPDVMSFGINPSGNTAIAVSSRIAQIGTTNNGTDRINTGGTPSSASMGTMTIGGTSNGWRDYSGSFTYSGTSGVQQVGFAADSSSGGISLGNFLDEIQITLRPYIEFDAASYTTREGQTAVLPRLRVIGTVAAGGIVVPVRITGGTATLGSDFTVTNGAGNIVNVSIPAGSYDNTSFDLPMTIVDDAVIEDNETVLFTAQPSPNDYTITSTTSCATGAAGQTTATLTILDNDVDVLTTKQVSTATPTPGGNFQFTVTYRNNTARPTVADTSVHDAAVDLADAVPTGLTFASWTCTASGGAACPAASGSGAISATATLPAGNATAGGSLTYLINATLGAGQCAAIVNTSTIAARAPFAEGTSAQSGFVTPAPGGSGNNSASASVDAVCASLSLTKSDNSPGYTPGGQADYVLHACNTNGPDGASGASINDALPNGATLRAPWTCTGTGGGTCPANGGAAGGNTIAVTGVTLPVGACVDVTVPVRFSANPADY